MIILGTPLDMEPMGVAEDVFSQRAPGLGRMKLWRIPSDGQLESYY
jgi:hypothetical protein